MNDNDIVRRTDIINRLLDRAKTFAGLIHVNDVIRIIKVAPSVNPQPKTDVLDKIRAEIVEEKECAYADFESYKVEYLAQDREDAYDSLPHDDFRYGMERAIEIINKYKAEREKQA